MQNILLLQHHSPFSSSHGREAFDMALALAAVEHQVTVLFCADAVYQLLATGVDTDFKLKAYPRSFKLFGLYDIEQVYVCQRALSERAIDTALLTIDVIVVDQQGIAELLANQHQVITA